MRRWVWSRATQEMTAATSAADTSARTSSATKRRFHCRTGSVIVSGAGSGAAATAKSPGDPTSIGLPLTPPCTRPARELCRQRRGRIVCGCLDTSCRRLQGFARGSSTRDGRRPRRASLGVFSRRSPETPDRGNNGICEVCPSISPDVSLPPRRVDVGVLFRLASMSQAGLRCGSCGHSPPSVAAADLVAGLE